MLHLRCRPAEFNAAPPDVAAFLSAARTAPADLADPLLWLPEPPTASPRVPLPPRAAAFPEFVVRPPTRSTRTLASLALAGGLLVAAPDAQAEEEDETGQVESEDGGESEEAEEEAKEEAPAAAAEVIVVPPAPEGPHPLSYEGDELWKAVRGARVEVTLKGNKVLVGTVLTQAEEEIAIARDPDGTVARVPKHMVRRLRVIGLANTPASVAGGAKGPPPKGDGPATAGAVLTIMGTSFMTTSAVIALAGGYYYGLPLFFFGSSMLGPGIPLLAAGIEQQVKYDDWERKNDLRLGLGVSPKGFAASFSFKF